MCSVAGSTTKLKHLLSLAQGLHESVAGSMHRIDRVGTKRLLVVLFQDALAGRLKVGFHLVPDGSCLAELEYSAAKLNASKSAPMLAARASRTICATWSLFPWRSEEHTSELQSLMRI